MSNKEKMDKIRDFVLKKVKDKKHVEFVLEFLKTNTPNFGKTILRIKRAPAGSNAPHVDYTIELIAPYLIAFVGTDALANLEISTDPFVTMPSFMALQTRGVKLVREGNDAFEKRGDLKGQQIITLGKIKNHFVNHCNNVESNY